MYLQCSTHQGRYDWCCQALQISNNRTIYVNWGKVIKHYERYGWCTWTINCSKSRLSWCIHKWCIHKLKRTNKVTNNVLRTLKLSNIQGTAIVMERLFAQISMYSPSFHFIKPTRKILSIERFNCNKLHLINVFRG